jgi:hypothetical protein
MRVTDLAHRSKDLLNRRKQFNGYYITGRGGTLQCWAELLWNWHLSVSQSVNLGFEPLCNSWSYFIWSKTIMRLISWRVPPDGRTGLSSLLDPVLESSPHDPLESSLLDHLLESSSLSLRFSQSVSQSVRLSRLWMLLCLTAHYRFPVRCCPNIFMSSQTAVTRYTEQWHHVSFLTKQKRNHNCCAWYRDSEQKSHVR